MSRAAQTKHVFVVSAPSGGGKTTLNRMLCSKYPQLELSVSLTTRPIRVGEQDGVDYHYVTKEFFKDQITNGQMLEWADVHGNMYGTTRSEIERIRARKHNPILEVDIQGWESVNRLLDSVVSVFILPPDAETLWQRLETRGTDAEAVRWRRMLSARKEIAGASSYHHFIINDDRDHAFAELERILIDGKAPQITHDEGVSHCQKLLKEFERADWLIRLEEKYGQK